MTAIPAIPEATYDCAKWFEQLRLRAYRDSVGYWTNGWGHLLTRDLKHPGGFPDITEEQASWWLLGDMRATAKSIIDNKMLSVRLTPGQWAAVLDFCFNLGTTRFYGSTLRRRINERAPQDEILFQFGRWSYGGGVRLRGLTRRRAGEAQLWVTGSFSAQLVDAWVPALDHVAPPRFKQAA